MNILSIILALLCSSIVLSHAQSGKRTLKKVSSRYVGTYSNKQHADTSSNPMYQRKQIIKGRYLNIKQKNKETDEKWVRIGWFAPEELTKPLDQRILRFYINNENEILVQLYYVTDEMYKQGWNYNKAHKVDLKKDACSCKIEIVNLRDKAFKMKQEAPYCKSDVRYGLYQKILVDWVFSKNKLINYNQFYDNNDQLLFSFDEGSIYKKVK